uniref:10 kDa heat shock protein, mitochondrial n=1 Tax=Ditylenchus dipsaci TaxID=166011 RepID=A0A915EAI2_9BILA
MVFTSIMRKSAVDSFKTFRPFFDRVVIERLAPELKTKGGIMIPEKAQGKVLEGTVVAVGPGRCTEEGKTIPSQVKPGDRVLLPEYGGSKVVIDEKEFHIFRESDLIGKFN